MNSLISIRYSSHRRKIIKTICNHSSGGRETLTSSEPITTNPSNTVNSAPPVFHWLSISTIRRADSANSEIFPTLTTFIASWPCLMATRRYLTKLASSILPKNKSASMKMAKSEYGLTVIWARTTPKSTKMKKITLQLTKRHKWLNKLCIWSSITPTHPPNPMSGFVIS